MNSHFSNHADAMPSVMPAINTYLMQMYHALGRRLDDDAMLSLHERAELCDDTAKLITTSTKMADREMATDILIALLRNAEKALKKAMAERFATVEDAPLRLILKFVHDDIDVAESILRHSPALNDLDLLYIIQSRDSPFWRVIATRTKLGDGVIDALVDTGDKPTSYHLASNNNVTLTPYALGRLIDCIEQDDTLAEAILARNDISRDFMQRIYNATGQLLQQRIIEQTDVNPSDAGRMVNAVVDSICNTAHSPYRPSTAMLKAADLFLSQGKINATLMTETVRKRQIAAFVAQFSRFTGMDVDSVLSLIEKRDPYTFTHTLRRYGLDEKLARDIINAITLD